MEHQAEGNHGRAAEIQLMQPRPMKHAGAALARFPAHLWRDVRTARYAFAAMEIGCDSK
jgi:hypothetical protein